MLQPGQVQVRNLVMGEGTFFEIVDFNPWQRVTLAPSQTPRAWNNGAWSGAEWAAARFVPMTICIRSTLDGEQILTCPEGDPLGVECDHIGSFDVFEDRQFRLAAAFAPIQDSTEQITLTFRFGSREYLMFGRPRMVDPNVRWISWVPPGGVVAQAQFVALDPLIHSSELHVAGPIGLGQEIGGACLPLCVPFCIESTLSGGELLLENCGTASAAMVIRIDGPVDQPRITLRHPDGTVQSLRFDVTLQQGQFLLIDTASRTVFLNGLLTASERGRTVGEFPLLPPGTSVLRFTAADFNDQAQITVSYRDAWY